MNIIKTYKFKLKPTKVQSQRMDSWIGVCRMIYNMALEIKIAGWNKKQQSISKNELQKQITEIRNEYLWIKDVHSQVLQDATDRLFLAYESFFKKRAGFPKFARKGVYSSFGFKQGIKLHPNTNNIFVPKLGKIKFRKSQEIIGQVKTAKIIKEVDGWYICIATETQPKVLPQPINDVIGIDLGIKSLVVLSDGEVVENPRHFIDKQRKLRIIQRAVNRKQKGSNNREKAKRQVSLLHKHISDCRKDFLHKLSYKLVNENQVISIEDLNVKGMVQNHKLAKHISDAGWGMFREMLTYKCEWYNRELYIADRFYASSKICSNCGEKNKSLKLKDRVWTCESCGTIHDRDINASMNLKSMAVGHIASSCGDSEQQCSDNCCASEQSTMIA